MTMADKRIAQLREKRRQLERKVLDAAFIWHAATILSGQSDSPTKADAMLRRACTRLMKVGWKVHDDGR